MSTIDEVCESLRFVRGMPNDRQKHKELRRILVNELEFSGTPYNTLQAILLYCFEGNTKTFENIIEERIPLKFNVIEYSYNSVMFVASSKPKGFYEYYYFRMRIEVNTLTATFDTVQGYI